MIRFFVVIVGFCFAVSGGVSLLAYLNLLTAGYRFTTYLQFIIVRVEFYLFIIGVMLVIGSYFSRRDRRRNK